MELNILHQFLSYFSRVKQNDLLEFQQEAIMKKVDQMYSLLAICWKQLNISLSSTILKNFKNMIKRKLSNQIELFKNKMRPHLEALKLKRNLEIILEINLYKNKNEKNEKNEEEEEINKLDQGIQFLIEKQTVKIEEIKNQKKIGAYFIYQISNLSDLKLNKI
ncbi:eukaryotic translation initiation factor 3 [Anaeramoeba ignava]|uniref:Eukaryotic translation initiation factor 3 n=1 Tax=Anaeramoeba ignava TaxID=1746090 RepID=A0A9Q0LUJ0_ANAIG|nr:eukaryotic translation initiation factor 3 [Anaeramoeba ignava]